MSDDLIKKQRPSDDSDEDYSGNLQNKNDEFGMEEYGYDLGSGKREDTDKQKRDDKKNDDEEEESKDAESRKNDEEYRKRLDDLETLRKMREEKKAKDLKIVKDREEKREEEEKKKEEQWESDETEKKEGKLIAGEKVERKRVFTHKKEEGVFRHKKLLGFNTKGLKKIDKRFKKVHGISSKKKRDFLKLLEAYNPSKSLLTKKAFDDFSRRFKNKRFTGPNFNRMKKEGVDLRSARKKFGKRDLDKLRRGITGEKDPHKYQAKSAGQKGSSPKSLSSGITAKMR